MRPANTTTLNEFGEGLATMIQKLEDLARTDKLLSQHNVIDHAKDNNGLYIISSDSEKNYSTLAFKSLYNIAQYSLNFWNSSYYNQAVTIKNYKSSPFIAWLKNLFGKDHLPAVQNTTCFEIAKIEHGYLEKFKPESLGTLINLLPEKIGSKKINETIKDIKRKIQVKISFYNSIQNIYLESTNNMERLIRIKEDDINKNTKNLKYQYQKITHNQIPETKKITSTIKYLQTPIDSYKTISKHLESINSFINMESKQFENFEELNPIKHFADRVSSIGNKKAEVENEIVEVEKSIAQSIEKLIVDENNSLLQNPISIDSKLPDTETEANERLLTVQQALSKSSSEINITKKKLEERKNYYHSLYQTQTSTIDDTYNKVLTKLHENEHQLKQYENTLQDHILWLQTINAADPVHVTYEKNLPALEQKLNTIQTESKTISQNQTELKNIEQDLIKNSDEINQLNHYKSVLEKKNAKNIVKEDINKPFDNDRANNIHHLIAARNTLYQNENYIPLDKLDMDSILSIIYPTNKKESKASKYKRQSGSIKYTASLIASYFTNNTEYNNLRNLRLEFLTTVENKIEELLKEDQKDIKTLLDKKNNEKIKLEDKQKKTSENITRETLQIETTCENILEPINEIVAAIDKDFKKYESISDKDSLISYTQSVAFAINYQGYMDKLCKAQEYLQCVTNQRPQVKSIKILLPIVQSNINQLQKKLHNARDSVELSLKKKTDDPFSLQAIINTVDHNDIDELLKEKATKPNWPRSRFVANQLPIILLNHATQFSDANSISINGHSALQKIAKYNRTIEDLNILKTYNAMTQNINWIGEGFEQRRSEISEKINVLEIENDINISNHIIKRLSIMNNKTLSATPTRNFIHEKGLYEDFKNKLEENIVIYKNSSKKEHKFHDKITELESNINEIKNKITELNIRLETANANILRKNIREIRENHNQTADLSQRNFYKLIPLIAKFKESKHLTKNRIEEIELEIETVIYNIDEQRLKEKSNQDYKSSLLKSLCKDTQKRINENSKKIKNSFSFFRNPISKDSDTKEIQSMLEALVKDPNSNSDLTDLQNLLAKKLGNEFMLSPAEQPIERTSTNDLILIYKQLAYDLDLFGKFQPNTNSSLQIG